MKKMAKIERNCLKCRKFTGNASFWRFGCSAGHTDKEDAALGFARRSSCPDYDQATRAELIAGADPATWSDGTPLKRQASNVKRLASSLAGLAHENVLGQFLTDAERRHLIETITILNGLKPDLDRASRLVSARHKEMTAKMRQKRAQEARELVERAVAQDGFKNRSELAESLHRFCASHAYSGSTGEIERQSGPSGSEEALVVAIAEAIEQLHRADRYEEAGGWSAFIAWRRACAG